MTKPEFTTNWFKSDKQREWRKQLAHLVGKNAQTLEIGSYEGRSAIWTADYLQNSLTTCVDPFTTNQVLSRFVANTKAYRKAGRISLRRGYSTAKLAEMIAVKNEFDFIYLDGSHEAIMVLSDATMAFQCLKVGGVMCFDDYTWNAPDCHVRPRAMIDSFLTAAWPFIEVLHKEKQVWIKKTRGVREFMRESMENVQ